jgi:hypothetical protein
MKTKTIFNFEAYPPNQEDGDNYPEKIHVEAENREIAREYLKKQGFYGIENCGLFHVSVAE